MRRRFAFYYPITTRRVDISRRSGSRYDHITDLLVKGSAYIQQGTNALDAVEDRYDFDIDEILYDEKDIYPVLESLGQLDEIESACFHHIHHLYSGLDSEYRIPEAKEPVPARIICFELKRKIN